MNHFCLRILSVGLRILLKDQTLHLLPLPPKEVSLMGLGKAWIQLFSYKLWVNRFQDWIVFCFFGGWGFFCFFFVFCFFCFVLASQPVEEKENWIQISVCSLICSAKNLNLICIFLLHSTGLHFKLHSYIYIYIYIYIYVCVCVYKNIHVCIYLCMCTCIKMCVCMYVLLVFVV